MCKLFPTQDTSCSRRPSLGEWRVEVAMRIRLWCVCLLGLMLAGLAEGQTPPGTSATQEPVLPYIPSLDLASLDKMADPCVNFYQYACGGWKKNNPIPPDQTSWSVY